MEGILMIRISGGKGKIESTLKPREAVIVLAEALHEAMKNYFREEAALIVKPN